MRDDQLCPVEILFLDKDQVAEELLSRDEGSSVAFICAGNMIQWIGYADVVRKMKERYHFTWFDRVVANPTQLDVIDAVQLIGQEKPEVIYALGGGSAIDTAKGISAFYDLVRDGADAEAITEAIKTKSYQKSASLIPIVAIPTTAGTGSEVTKWATIWDYKQRAKFSIDMPSLYPKTALISVDFTMTLPKRMVLSTALDAMAHAMEASWSKQTTPIVQEIGWLSVSKVHEYLPIALKDLSNIEARKELCLASLLAGIAFSNTRTTACHSISYPITMEFGVEHGFAVAMSLDIVSRINLTVQPKIQRILDIFMADGGLQSWMDCVSSDIQELRLSAFGIKSEDLPKLVSMSFTQGRMNNNPVDLSPEQVADILREIL